MVTFAQDYLNTNTSNSTIDSVIGNSNMYHTLSTVKDFTEHFIFLILLSTRVLTPSILWRNWMKCYVNILETGKI